MMPSRASFSTASNAQCQGGTSSNGDRGTCAATPPGSIRAGSSMTTIRRLFRMGHLRLYNVPRLGAVAAAGSPERLDHHLVLLEQRDEHALPAAVVPDVGRRLDVADHDLSMRPGDAIHRRGCPAADEQHLSGQHDDAIKLSLWQPSHLLLLTAGGELVRLAGRAERHDDDASVWEHCDAVGLLQVRSLRKGREGAVPQS